MFTQKMRTLKTSALAWMICALIAYVGLFFGLYAVTGLALGVCAVLPVAAVAWFLGLYVGLIAGLLATPVNLLLCFIVGMPWLETLTGMQFISGSLGLVMVGVLVGRMRDLSRALRHQRDTLHKLAEERTIGLRESHARLKAREQELTAVNMQLSAHEQQLMAVNEQLRAQEQELRDANEYLENIFETKADGLVVTDRGSIIKINRALEHMLGYQEEELLGRNILDIAGMHSTDRALARGMTLELYRQGCITNRQFVWHAKDGSACPVEVNITLLKTEDGRPRGSVCEVRDISEHRRIDDERTRMIAAMEQTGEFMMIFDHDGIIQYCNAALEHMTGYSREQLINKSYTVTSNDPEQHKFYKGLLDFVRTGTVWKGRISPTVSDGSQREYEITISPVRGRDGEITSFVSIGRDVTRELFMERQLRQAQKMEAIGTLAGGIAHDFNNILTAILGYAELSMREAPEGSSLSARLMHILTSGNRARDLVKQILTFSRRGEPAARPVRFKSVLQEALHLMRSTMPVTIEMRTNIRTDAIVVADPTQLHQIVMNLCSNADHAMAGSSGVLTVNLREEQIDAHQARVHAVSAGPYVCLEVNDTGAGMSPECLEHIFEPFYTTKAGNEGTGMGLAVVHGIVNAVNGFATVRSKSGVGSTFRIYLPVAAHAVPDCAVVQTTLPRGTEHILFVDDELTIVELMTQMLSSLGYRVSSSHMSTQALELFERTPQAFDLVITDRTMPRMTGLELAGHIRSLRPEIPIILCSGYRLDQAEQSIRDCGINATLVKPLNFQTVAETIRSVLENTEDTAVSSAEVSRG